MSKVRFAIPELRDLVRINEIYRKYHQDSFGLPSLDRSVTGGVAKLDDKIVAFGMVTTLIESILVLDLGESTRVKIEAIKVLMDRAIADSQEQGFGWMHMFVQDPHFAQILKKHYKAQVCSGEALVISLENHNG